MATATSAISKASNNHTTNLKAKALLISSVRLLLLYGLESLLPAIVSKTIALLRLSRTHIDRAQPPAEWPFKNPIPGQYAPTLFVYR
jgi:hypothetical protein